GRNQRARESLRFDPMRRVEVVALLEHLELEVGKDPSESSTDLAKLVGVAQSTKREVDGPIKAFERRAVEVVRLERLHERSDATRALRHPVGRIPRRRWRKF